MITNNKSEFKVEHIQRAQDTDSWWRHQMETFSALLAICAGNSPVPGEFPTQRPVTRSFDAYFDLRPNKRLSKQWWGWWFETQSCPLWRHRNVQSFNYRQTSNMRRTKSKNLNASCLVLQLSECNPLEPGVKARMKMWLEQRRQVLLQLHLNDEQFNCLLRCDSYQKFDGTIFNVSTYLANDISSSQMQKRPRVSRKDFSRLSWD